MSVLIFARIEYPSKYKEQSNAIKDAVSHCVKNDFGVDVVNISASYVQTLGAFNLTISMPRPCTQAGLAMLTQWKSARGRFISGIFKNLLILKIDESDAIFHSCPSAMYGNVRIVRAVSPASCCFGSEPMDVCD